MEINCRISPDLDNLDNYHKVYSWIPGSGNIRPSEDILRTKQVLFDQVSQFYENMSDYILEEIFKIPVEFTENTKLKAKNYGAKHYDEFKFVKNKFPYKLDKNTNHYIIWYNTRSFTYSDSIINKHITKSIFEILQHKNFEYVWYENPKMNIPNIYHLQVFWKTCS